MKHPLPSVTTSTLSGVPETLLITLAARLLAGQLNPDLKFADPAALAVGKALDFDPARFAHDRASMRGSVVRGQWFDRMVRQWLERHKDGLIVSIGSGLDTRANRLMPERHDLGGTDWVDIDAAEVVALRQACIPSLPNVQLLPGDGTRVMDWADKVPWRENRPVMVIAEGVSMYLQPDQGMRWLSDLAETAAARRSGLTLALDLASPLMVSQSHRHPSVSQTGARFAWGLRRPEEITRAIPRLRLVETYDVARHCGLASSCFALAYRLLTLGRPVYSCARFVTQIE
ncbi:class I SAM-dependent methyltransferase [Novosphingobium terrae]|uniref:class I SAM-dependent methyltransferase n=1 Tax=Novosphingobium terrae TaxID=2726189 RepID=UPI0019820324|nr:class I SAM-dependent methyltransferase [Novosphingobium terrae]